MTGRLKFVDSTTGDWGFIAPEDGSADIHFVQGDVIGTRLETCPAKVELEFDVDEDDRGRHARNIRILGEGPLAQSGEQVAGVGDSQAPGGELLRWAYIVLAPFVSRDGIQVPSAISALADSALEERWYFGETQDDTYPILGNYLKFTFFRLQKESKVIEKDNWAAFNTGLVDKLYDPIFALFKTNRRDLQPWRFHAFCVPGKGPAGRQLTSVFDPLPEPATYFRGTFDMFLDTSREIYVDYDHVILDGVRRDRFPYGFLSKHQPRDFRPASDAKPRQVELPRRAAGCCRGAPETGSATVACKDSVCHQSNRSSVTMLVESMILRSLAAACRMER